MKGPVLNRPLISGVKLPLLVGVDSLPCAATSPAVQTSYCPRWRGLSRRKQTCSTFQAQAFNVSIGSGEYEGRDENENKNALGENPPGSSSSTIKKIPSQIPYPLSVALVLFGCALVFSLIVFVKGGPSSLLAAIAKSGFTAAFTLIFVSEIGDKTFFIAALLAMQYRKGLVLLGSMGALSLMTILSVVIGKIFQSVPAQFQTSKLSCSFVFPVGLSMNFEV